jgi:uncharacterized secreted protein with C-terminal beta-propeller domain
MRTLALFVVLSLALAAAPAEGARKRAATPKLKAFASCSGLISYARRHAPPPRPVLPPRRPDLPIMGGGQDGGSGPVAAPAPAPAPDSNSGGGGSDSSTTNVQEGGVDEPDIVKSDGTNVFALTGGKLHAVDARSPLPRKLDAVAIPGYGGELLVQGRRALAITTAAAGGTVLTEIDIANPAAMRVLRTLTVDGSYVSARQHDHTARIVLSSQPRALDVVAPPTPRPVVIQDRVVATAAKRKPLRARKAGWVPSATLRNRRTGRKRKRAIVACDDVRRTPRFTGAGMLTVLTVDFQHGLPAVDADSVMTDADTVYASPTSLYVATNGGWQRSDTSIHRFDLAAADSTVYRASGQVPGDLLNQFSLSEHKGVLRAATTEQSGGESQSHVTVLEPRSGRLERIGQVSGLGKGERIYAVRFIEDRGYVVTFRQTDPLYTLDLADPAHPRVRGELKILGYSSYLHPVGEHELLGIGQDATAEGIRQGTQLSLFDVADPAAPKLLHKIALGEASSSDAEYDHHAFLWWAPTRLAVVPISDFSTEDAGTQAVGFNVDRVKGITEAGRSRESGAVLRTLVVGGRLFTLTEEGLRAYDLGTLAAGPFAPF